MNLSTDNPSRRNSDFVKVVVASGWDESTVASAALAHFAPVLGNLGGGPLAVAVGDDRVAKSHRPVLDLVLSMFGSQATSKQVVVPTKIALSGWIRTRSEADPWSAVDVDSRSERLRTAWLRREIAEAATVLAVNRIPSGESLEPLILGLWAMFAHPRQRIGALAGDDRTGLRAEIATAVKPALCILCGDSRDRPLIVVTSDQIAAELTGRAVQALLHPDPFGDRVGPWELPLIQRATELDLGISLPKELAIEAAWAGNPGEPGEQLLQATVGSIRLTLGVPDS